MKEPKSIKIGAVYIHKEGLRYKIESIILNATEYEKGRPILEYVVYEQLDAGKYPVGTKWVREKQDFLNNFSLKN